MLITSKKVFKVNILNSFFITILKYQDTGRQHPIPAPGRLETRGPLYLEASLTGLNRPLKRDDPMGEGSTGRVNTNLLALHVFGQRKSNSGFLPFDFARFLEM